MPVLKRVFDSRIFNEIANDPDVRPWVGGDGELDLTPLVSDPQHVALLGEKGGFLLQRLDEGVYELHTLYLKEGRGKAFFLQARQMFRIMFTETPCLEIVTKCPDDNVGARSAAATVGFRERFRREDAWAKGVGISYRVFSIDDWFVRDAVALMAGRKFHAALDAARGDKDDRPGHEDDEAHDRAVGAAVLMAWAGLTAKGVGFYNRWAAFAGYLPVMAVGPGLVDVQDAIVALQDHDVEVLHLR